MMQMPGMMIFAAMLCSILWICGQYVFGTLLSTAWQYLYGPERTSRARIWVIGLPAMILPMVSLYLLSVFVDTPVIPEYFVWTSMMNASFLGGLWFALAPIEPYAARQPLIRRRDHDSITLDLAERRTLPMIVFSWLLLLFWPVAFPVALAFRRASPPRISLRLRSDLLEITGDGERMSVPLAGVTARREVAWDGTPEIVLSREGGETRIAVGGHPPNEVAWVIYQIDLAAAHATPDPTPETPEAMRQLLRHRRGQTVAR